MGEQPWSERTLFNRALSQPPESRERFVEESDAPDQIKLGVKDLLKHHSYATESFLEPDEFDGMSDGLEGFKRIGPYALKRRIAAGGMGVVYEGWDERLKRRVAVKILAPYMSDSVDARERLANEARIVAKLNHPGIVQVHDVVESDEVLAIVSQFVDGGTLADLVGASPAHDADAPRKPGKPLPIDQALFVVRSVAAALVHAHDAGVIHRDLKPSNILLDGLSGEPRLTDFGIAKLLTNTEVLHTSAGAGTCYYMSPEQIVGDSSAIGPASDVFSLGVVLYELLTGVRPFEGPTRDSVTDAIKRGHPEPPRTLRPEIGHDLQVVCLKAMETDQRYRYPDCQELVDELDRVIEGVPILATPPSLARRAREAFVARRQFILTTGALCLGVGGGAVIMRRVLDRRPRLRVASESLGTLVTVHAWDPETMGYSDPVYQFRGSREVALDPGFYRVRFDKGDGVQEYERLLERDQRLTLMPGADRGPAGEHATDGMVLITPPTPEQLALAPDKFAQGVRDVRAFWIDAHEVTNAQYHAFVEATGRQAPGLWPTPYDKAWDELPVTSVSLEDAQAYAEWAGKRLPTFPEWRLAARGPTGFDYPWGPAEAAPDDAEPQEPRGNYGGHSLYVYNQWDGKPELRQAYLSGVRPVGEGFGEDTRVGITHLMGNVMEWTNTPTVTSDTGVAIPNFNERYICGRPWGEPYRQHFTLAGYATDSHVRSTISRGFRCARSAKE